MYDEYHQNRHAPQIGSFQAADSYMLCTCNYMISSGIISEISRSLPYTIASTILLYIC